MDIKDKQAIKKALFPSLLSSSIIIALTVPLVIFFIISSISIITAQPYTSFPWWMWIPLIIVLLILIIPAFIILINEISILRNKEINNEQITKLSSKIFKSSICCIVLYSIYFAANLVLFLIRKQIKFYIFGVGDLYEFLLIIFTIVICLIYPILHCIKFNKKAKINKLF